MIEVSTSPVTSAEANGILSLWVNQNFQALLKAISSDLAVTQVSLGVDMSKGSAVSLAKGEIPVHLKSDVIKAGELETTLRILAEYGSRTNDRFIEATLHIS